MKISDKLSTVYGDYYRDQQVLRKREISGRQAMMHLLSILPQKKYESILDVGAGDGSVLSQIEKNRFSENLHAVEISKSGCEAIISRELPSLRSVKQFDGYSIQSEDKAYELGLAIHVLEHVEHERVFLAEILRVSKFVYLEVPLELTLSVDRAIKYGGLYGHINFYTPSTFINLLESANLTVIDFKIFSNTLEYECFVGGKIKGHLKWALRRLLLLISPQKAPFFLTYMGGALCTQKMDEVVE